MDKLKNSIYGFILGDAYGLPYEFKYRGTFETNKEMVGYGNWNVPAGTWSDDSAMTLITMQHLTEGKQIRDLKEKFCDWVYEGYWSFNDKPAFDVGRTTFAIISDWENESISIEASSEEKDNGNGALMRMLPIALFTYKKENAEEMIHAYAKLTHGHMRSVLACRHYVYVIHSLLDGMNLKDAIRDARAKLRESIAMENEIDNFSRLEKLSELPKEEIKSTGYVIDTLEASYWCVLNTDNYLDAIDLATNLGGDTDTIAAITGSLAGLYFDELNVPSKWFDLIPKKYEIELLIMRFNKMVAYQSEKELQI